MKHSKRYILQGTLFLLIAFVGIDCAKNPVTGKKQLVLISEAQEIALGEESHPQILAEFGQVEDARLQSYVNAIGQEMARDSHRPDLPWHFTVVDSPVVNAFAVPGGYIYLTREILAYMNNEAELAGVLGHEIGHVTARHSVSQISKAQLFGLGLGVGSIFSPTFQRFGQLAEVGVGVLFLKYGRDAERQSDELGVQYMYQQDYDPRQLSRFFEVFQKMREESGQALPNWLSSHPSPPDRIRATRQLAATALSKGPERRLKVNRREHLDVLENLIFGDNPREGYTRDGLFLHPDLRFQLGYPASWRVNNTKSSVLFADPNGGAVIQLTLAPRDSSPEGRAQQLSQQPGVQLVRGQPDRINGNDAFIGLYQVQDQQGNQIRALAAFIRHRGNLYQVVGMSTPSGFNSYSRTLEESLLSFQELTDRRALAVQPDRIHIYQVRRGGTLQDVARQYANPRVTIDELEALNRMDSAERLEAGTLVKVVEAGRR